MTRLKKHLKQNGIRQSDFAEAVGLTQATISRIAAGSAIPSLEVAVKIDRLTKGAVPVTGWIQEDGEAA